MFPVTSLSNDTSQLLLSETESQSLLRGESISSPKYSATIIDKLDNNSDGSYFTTVMTANTPFDFDQYTAVDKIPKDCHWGICRYNESASGLGHVQYIRLKCQHCQTPVPFVLQGERGCYYFSMPSFMEKWDITCLKCKIGLWRTKCKTDLSNL
jgi:hypothetical protein